jgi:hypothetical protein
VERGGIVVAIERNGINLTMAFPPEAILLRADNTTARLWINAATLGWRL